MGFLFGGGGGGGSAAAPPPTPVAPGAIQVQRNDIGGGNSVQPQANRTTGGLGSLTLVPLGARGGWSNPTSVRRSTMLGG